MLAQILQPTPENVARVASHLRAGGVAGMPTETVYGLAAHAFDPAALAKVFSVKERPTFDPLIVHVTPPSGGVLAHLGALGVADPEALSPLAHERVEALGAAFWPGPLTLVLPRGPRVPDLATSGLGTAAVRCPRHPVAQALLAATGAPLCAPSANRFGRISPTRAADVVAELGDRIEYVLDGGPCELGLESTVLAVAPDGAPALLRPGGVSRAELERVLGAPVALATASGPVEKAAPAPGMLASHYAPRKALHLLGAPVVRLAQWAGPTWPTGRPLPARVGLLAQSGDPSAVAAQARALSGREVRVEVLSPRGDLAEAARRLFGALRALDASDAELLFAEPCPSSEGLGHAIQDRLGRAAQR